MANNDNYRVLSHREQAREKLPIWFGSRDNFYHGYRELLANARDEINKNFKDGKVTVLLKGDNNISVTDTGRGMDLLKDVDGKPLYEIIFETFFAGGKMDDNAGLTGTNGVGLTMLNYTSKRFVVKTSIGDGREVKVSYSDGGQNRVVKEGVTNEGSHYLSIDFVLDPDMYTETNFEPEVVYDIFNHVLATSPKLKGSIKLGNKPMKNIHYDSLSKFFIQQINRTNTSPFVQNNEDINSTVYDLTLTTTAEVVTNTYLNGTHFIEESSVDRGLIQGLRLELNKQGKSKRGFTPFTKEDILNSFSYAISLESKVPEFKGQTKFSTEKKDFEDGAKQVARDLISRLADENVSALNKIFKHVKEVQKANNGAEKARANLKKKLEGNIDRMNNRVDKLINSRVHGLEAELYIAEGDSAKTSISQARDSKFQAVYPLRGKILNVMKATDDEVAKNDVITDLIKVIGTGIGKDFDMDKARFGKIILAHDADSDGGHIASLALAIIYKYMRPLLENGMVYDAKTPLYMIHYKKSDEITYLYTEDEYNKFNKQKKTNIASVSRLKGLGEIDADVMRQVALDTETRNLQQITMDNEFFKTLDNWLGKDVNPRKDEISNRLSDFIEEVF